MGQSEKWLVKNNTGTMFFLPKNRIKFEPPNTCRDLVAATGKTVEELERDPEISINVGEIGDHSRGLVTVEKIKAVREEIVEKIIVKEKSLDIENLENKINSLASIIEMLVQRPVETSTEIDEEKLAKLIQENMNITFVNGENIVSRENEKGIEKAIERMVSTHKKPDDKNFESLGKNIEVDDDALDNVDILSDLI